MTGSNATQLSIALAFRQRPAKPALKRFQRTRLIVRDESALTANFTR
jgi:hypothetical protein